jgi:DNA-binding beta-propeller fold protein YncE
MRQFLCLLLLLCPCLSAQEVLKEIDVDDGGGAPDYLFGMKLNPDGSELYAAVCGTFSDPNNRLVVVDTFQDLLLPKEGVTGKFPEEIEFRLDGSGDIELIFVSDSTDGTVTVLKPDLTLESTLVLAPSSPYPFGLIMGPSGRYLYVSTVNMGEIFVIDTDPGSTYLQVVDQHTVAAFNGRLATYNGKLIIPGSDFTNGAVLSIMDLNQPSQVDAVLLDGDLAGYPGANDVHISKDGYAYVTVLDYNNSALLYEVDLDRSPPAVSRTIDLSAQGPYLTLEHGIGASPDGNTLVVTYMDDAYIKTVSRKTGCVLDCFYVDPAHYGQINECVFSKDGDKVYLTNQAQPVIHVLGGVPEHGLWLTGEEETVPGGQVSLYMRGGEKGGPGLLLWSLTLGPIVTPTYEMEIGTPYYLLFYSVFDAGNNFPVITINCPNDPGLSGLSVYFQGLTRDSDKEFRPSNLHTVQIQ